MKHHKHVIGFTLAEVLITIGIIGIVAALTLPNLISNYKKQVISKKLAKYYTTMNQAIINSEIENGPYETWDFTLDSQDFYDIYLAKYLKTIKVERSSDKRFLYIHFADGTMASMGYTSCINFYPKIIKKVIDKNIFACSNFQIENTYAKYGKDQFEFRLCNSSWWMNYKGKQKFEPWGTKGCTTGENIDPETLNNDCKNPDSGRYCTEIIKRNGWEIPKNYPIRI